MSSRPPSSVLPVTQPQGGVKKTDRLLRWIVVVLLIVSVIVTTAYTALSIYIATQLVYVPQKSLYATPASLGLQFKYVTFPSRIDQMQLKGWYIPGVLPNGNLTSQRTIIMVHGTRTNRADKDAVHHVLRFREKPNADLAESFLRKGNFRWNAGMFVWSVPTVLSEFNRHTPELADFISQIRAPGNFEKVLRERL